MKTMYVTCVTILCCAVWLTPSDCRADQLEDEASIRKNAEAYVLAYNNNDAKVLAGLWSPEAVYTDQSTGELAVGREEIQKVFTDILAALGDAKLEVEVKSVEFVSPNVAIENGITRVIRPNDGPVATNYTAVSVKRDGKWLLDRISEEESPAPPPSNYEHLKDLEWMIGSWIDQDESSMIQTDCEWTKNQNFMTRSFAIVVGDQVDMAGMQIIGWDPVAEQIRSWTFDSDGGFAEGNWTRKDNRWLIRQTAILPDGRKSSAVNIITYVDDNSCRWQSINRVVDGDVLPNVDEVLVVRKPAK
ncbi:MAG: SgcJ/EcaC family oxidoreductase [Pirellulales bacterium]